MNERAAALGAGTETPPSDETPGVEIDLPVIVGKNLRRLRTRRGHSLERLARLSGVSRAMLGQIETGKSVPTISLLWKVATALDVPFATLIAAQELLGTVVLPRERAKVLSSSDGQFTSRALFPFDSERRVEFYELRLAPHHRENAEPHAVKCNGEISGAEENLARGLVAEYLSGARVEFVLDPLDIGIGQNREVGTFWEVLPEEAVSVFVEAAFPRVIGLGKIG